MRQGTASIDSNARHSPCSATSLFVHTPLLPSAFCAVASCTVVLKPSEFTPYSAFALAELGTRAGLPAGCFNLVTGDASMIGSELTSSKVVKKITFTGSTRVGKLLLKQCADTVKRTSMELGGNAPYIVSATHTARRGVHSTACTLSPILSLVTLLTSAPISARFCDLLPVSTTLTSTPP